MKRKRKSVRRSDGALIDIEKPEKYNDFAVLGNLKEKLAKTSQALREKFEELLQSSKPRDRILDELAEVLILADAGIATTDKIVLSLKEKTKKDASFPEIQKALQEELVQMLGRYPSDLAVDGAPAVIMMVGVNGGGKTTSMAKLACLE